MSDRPAVHARFLAVVLTLPVAAGCGGCEEDSHGEEQALADEPAEPPVDPGPVLAPPGARLVDVAEAGPTAVRILLAEGGRGRVCEAGQIGRVGLPLGRVTCRDVDRAITVDGTTRIAPAREPYAPTLLRVPGRGLVEPGGRRWTATPLAAVEVDRGGATAVTRGSDGRPAALVRLEDGEETSRVPLPAVPFDVEPVVAGGSVWTVTRIDGRARLARVTPDGATVHGPEAGLAESLGACRGANGAVVHVLGAPDPEAGTRRIWVAFAPEGRDPRVVAGIAGLAPGAPVCRGAEATFSWIAPVLAGVDDRPMGHELRCRPGGCTATSSPLGIAGTSPAITELADRALLAWSGADGTRVRLAPLAVIEKSEDLGVLEETRAPPRWRAWVVRAGGALLLEGRRGGTVAYRLDATGEHARVEPTDG